MLFCLMLSLVCRSRDRDRKRPADDSTDRRSSDRDREFPRDNGYRGTGLTYKERMQENCLYVQHCACDPSPGLCDVVCQRYVSGLNAAITVDVLRPLFEKFGPLTRCEIKKRFAFVG